MATLSAVGASRPPQSIEEYMVGALEKETGCATEAVIPPPVSCPDSVHAMYRIGQFHVMTILFTVIFVIVLIQMVILAINPNAGGH